MTIHSAAGEGRGRDAVDDCQRLAVPPLTPPGTPLCSRVGAPPVRPPAMPLGAAWTVLTGTLAAGFALFAAVVLAPPVTSLCHAVMAAGMVFLLLATASGG